MDELTQRWTEGAEEARQRLFPNSRAALCGKDPTPPRGHKELLVFDKAWYALYSSHNLSQEAGTVTSRKRTLDFFVAEREGLTSDVVKFSSSITLDGLRYTFLLPARHEVAAPLYWRFICVPTGETT